MPDTVNKVFVYGTLLQGEIRSPLMSDCRLLNSLEIPGTLYDTGMGYPTVVFDEDADTSISGELYIMDNPGLKLQELDNIEGVGSGLYKRVKLSYRDLDFYSYEAGSGLKQFIDPVNEVAEGNWRRHATLCFNDPVKFALNFEDRQKYLYRDSVSAEADGLIYARGDIPIIVTAPHSSVHKRMGKLKRQEFYTAAISMMMYSLTGCHSLYTNRLMESDPNYYDESPFKTRLSEIVKNNDIKCLIDLHGTGPERESHIYPGVGVNKEFLAGNDNYLEELDKASTLNEITIGGLDVFPAAKQMTVTKFAAKKLGIPAIQLEINRQLREPNNNPEQFIKLIRLLKVYIDNLSYLIS